MKHLLCALFLFGTCAAHAASEQHLQAAVEFLEVCDVRSSMDQGFKVGLAPTIESLKKMGLPEQGVKELQDAAMQFYAENFKWDDIKNQLAAMYCEDFSEAELKELSAFYRTPLGKKAIQKMPTMMQRGSEWGTERVAGKSDELQKKLQPILMKYQNQLKPPSTP